jgi:hypothetical protein
VRRLDLTFDCHDAQRLAEFWRLALGYEHEPAPAPFASREEWLRHHDVPPEEWGDSAYLRDPAGAGPRLSILRVPEPKTAKNRLHLDLRVSGDGSPAERWAEVRAEAARLSAAGGAVLYEDGTHHITMADPEGNEFCLT